MAPISAAMSGRRTWRRDRIDRRLTENKSGKRRAVVVMRERGGRTLPQVFAAEDAALASIGQRIAQRERRFMPMRALPGTLCMPAFP